MYHPRSSHHGDTLVKFILDDLIETCPAFRTAAKEGKIVYKLNHAVNPNTPDEWDIDLIVGPGGLNFQQTMGQPITAGEPTDIWIAVDAKGVMTEHGKARKNRYRDLSAFHSKMHGYRPNAIAAGIVTINIAPRFRSPLRPEGEVTEHKNIERLAEETVALFAGLPKGNPGLEAISVIVLAHTNIKGDQTTLRKGRPSPAPGELLSYDLFVRDICREFQARHGSGLETPSRDAGPRTTFG